jgi:TetR/AcrR family transcriptional repressor of nem operon
MTDPDSTTRSRGRPRAFDETRVLDAAMNLFWEVGYRDASVPAISAATGLSTSSLYNVYGSKLGLFEAALGRYLEEIIDGYMVGPLARGSAGLADVEAFLGRLERTIERDPARGCLAVNTMAEQRHLPPRLAAAPAAYRSMLREGLHAALTRAAEQGEISAEAVDPGTAALVPMVIAFNVLLAAGAPAHETRDVLDRARAVARGEHRAARTKHRSQSARTPRSDRE